MTTQSLYVSGPISSDKERTLDQKRARFAIAADELQLANYLVVNPFDVAPACDGEGGVCAYGDPEPGAQDTVHSHACFLRADMKALLNCDAVATLDGWRESKGAQMEVNLARSVNMIVAPVEEWLNDTCLRCGVKRSLHYRPGCHYEGAGARSVCSECGAPILRIPGAWTTDPLNYHARFCRMSKDPDPIHIPLNAGDLRG